MAQGNVNNISSGYLNLPLDNTPIGTIIKYSGTVLPPDYLACDGSAISRTTYADLFALTGTIYGSGDNSTTFNLPNTYSYIRRNNGVTKGSSNTNVVIYGTSVESSGTDITYINSATAGDSFKINTSGIYSVSIDTSCGTSTYVIDIKVGSAIDNVTGNANTRANDQIAANYSGCASWTGYIAENNLIWTYCSGVPASQFYNQITIVRVS